MDNLNVHKTPTAMKLYDELDILPIFNITYMPDLNPIEAVFSQVKRMFCQRRLWHLVNGIDFDIDNHVENAFDVITPELV